MSSEQATPTQTVQRAELGNWKGGVLAGIAGGVVMGAMLTTTMTPVIEMAIPAMYGLQGGLAGWVAHMSHAAILGVVFAAVAGATGYGDDLARSAGLGVAYGVVLWVVLAALVMPVWLGAVGFAGAPPLPNFDPMSLLAHVVYGLVLGAAYPYVRDL